MTSDNVLVWDFEAKSRSAEYHFYPVACVHVGHAACNESVFKRDVARIKNDPMGYWLGLGDTADFVNIHDHRFSISQLAPWLQVGDLSDLAAAQRERFCKLVEPIAAKCRGLGTGNHEAKIKRVFERDIYREICDNVHLVGGFLPEQRLDFGYEGWVILRFQRCGGGDSSVVKLYLHHGFTGGHLAGAKALAMQRKLWQKDCDVVVMAHSHNMAAYVDCVDYLDKEFRHEVKVKHGVFAGTYFDARLTAGKSYADTAGYPTSPIGGVCITIRPFSLWPDERIRVTV